MSDTMFVQIPLVNHLIKKRLAEMWLGWYNYLLLSTVNKTLLAMGYVKPMQLNSTRLIYLNWHKQTHYFVGTSRLVGIADRSKLSYTEATIHEVMRLKTLIPLALPHTATCDTTIGEFIKLVLSIYGGEWVFNFLV